MIQLPISVDCFSISRRKMLGLTTAAATSFCWQRLGAASLNQPDPKTNETIRIGAESGVVLTFERRGLQFSLQQIQRQTQPPILYGDSAMLSAGSGPIGNPLSLVVLNGPQQGTYGMDTFEVTQLEHSPTRLMVYLRNNRLPMQIGLEITTEGDVVEWRGQAVWQRVPMIRMWMFTILCYRAFGLTRREATASSRENSLGSRSLTLPR